MRWSEPVDEEEEAGDVSTSDRKTWLNDGATSVIAFGAAIIAAISTLAF